MKKTSGSLLKRGNIYYARWMIGGKLTSRTTGEKNRAKALAEMQRMIAPFVGVDEIEALERVSARIEGRKAEVAQLEADANPPPKIGTVANGVFISPVWLAYAASTNRPDSGDGTLKQYEGELKRFVEWLSQERPEVEYLHQVTTKDADAYARNLNAAKVSASTFNQHCNFLCLLWRVLAEPAQLPVNIWHKGLITRRKLTKLATRRRALTPTQFDALLHATGDDKGLQDLFLLLAWTGQRLGDVVMLKWGSVDYALGVITLAPRKTLRRSGKTVAIPLFPSAREVLTRRESGQPVNPNDYVFPELVEAYESDPAKITKRITAAFSRAGMETSEERSDRKRGVVLYGAHSLRHLAVTAFTSAGMPAAMIKSITGHSSDGMLEHYQHIGVAMASEIAARITAKTLPSSTALLALSDSTPLHATLLELVEAHGLKAVKDALKTIAGNTSGKR